MTMCDMTWKWSKHQWSDMYKDGTEWSKKWCKNCDRWEYYKNGKFDFAVDLSDVKHKIPANRNKPEP